MQSYLLYLAARPKDQETTRCCDDVPPVGMRRPSSTKRRARKLGHALPLSLRTFRRSIGAPFPPVATVTAGAPVVTATGRPVGHVREVVLGLGSGDTAVAVVPAHAGSNVGTVFLLPSRSVRTRDDGVVVLDARSSRLVA